MMLKLMLVLKLHLNGFRIDGFLRIAFTRETIYKFFKFL